MVESDLSLYYTLVWNTTLELKGERFIKGEKITKTTKLPSEPSVLYGTHNNDLKKIRNIEVWEEVIYDVATTKQSVRFHESINEYELCRDVRIIVWEGSPELDLFYDSYKIVTPEMFEDIANYSKDNKCSEEGLLSWDNYKSPVSELSGKCRDAITLKKRSKDTVKTEFNKGKLTKLSLVH